MPSEPRMFTAQVVRTQRVSPSFQRVTIASGDLCGFDWRGLDHWFRLFFPVRPGGELRLPEVKGRQWWQSYLDIPEADRPHCSNYTVAEYRCAGEVAELDIDVVLHWHEGELSGVARWAVHAEPDSPAGLLDQGVLFDPPSDAEEFVLVSDESGLPAVRGILRDLPSHAVGTAIIEVPAADDVHPVTAPTGMRIQWVARGASDPVGHRALSVLRDCAGKHPGAYAFVVGESRLATQGRRTLHQAGVPKSRITFSGFWRA
ncbi:siderophore-interacting protein [Micropruina sp.]|uniref:siderophore-interacting protein n=1 Tax=Micropruina sp. TaxID=2737536 RepID=UPI0039E33536